MKLLVGILSGSLVSTLYMLSSRAWYWWVLASIYILMVAYVRNG